MTFLNIILYVIVIYVLVGLMQIFIELKKYPLKEQWYLSKIDLLNYTNWYKIFEIDTKSKEFFLIDKKIQVMVKKYQYMIIVGFIIFILLMKYE